MFIHAYGRFEKPEDESAFRDAVFAKFPETAREQIKFHRDGIAGQRGLNAALHAAGKGDTQLVVLRQFSDAGRDIGGAIRNVAAMMGNTTVWFLDSAVELGPRLRIEHDEPWRLMLSLADALKRYAKINQEIGVQTARAAGAQVGRPATFTLARVRKDLQSLTDANEGRFPSVRRVAKELGCSKATAHRMLLAFRSEKAAHAGAEQD